MPVMMSAPSPPVMMSFPSPPKMKSLPAPPRMVSLPPVCLFGPIDVAVQDIIARTALEPVGAETAHERVDAMRR